MTTRQNLTFAVNLTLLAIAGNVIWIGEIIYRFTWASLAWLYPLSYSTHLFSPYLLVVFPSIAFLLPFLFQKRISTGKLPIAIILFYFIDFIFYYLGEQIMRAYFNNKVGLIIAFFGVSEHILMTAFLTFIPILLLLFFGLSYFLLIRAFIVRVQAIYILLFAFILLLILPLSFLTYRVLPINSDNECFYNAIKAGYPVFWTTILMGLCGWLIEKKTQKGLLSNTS